MGKPEAIVIYAADDRFSTYLKSGFNGRTPNHAVIALNDVSRVQRALASGGVSALIAELHSDNTEDLLTVASFIRKHPETPCVVVAERTDERIRDNAFAMGALAFVPKSAELSNIIDRIVAFVNPGSDGGKLFSISPFAFLQMIKMEQRTCTITVKSTKMSGTGSMYFLAGKLMEARSGKKMGQAAVIEMLLWGEVDIRIHNYCPVEVRRISESLEALLLEAERLRDEQISRRPDAGTQHGSFEFLNQDAAEDGELKADFFDRLTGFLKGRKGILDASVDPTWDDAVDFGKRASPIFDYGKLLTCYISGSHMQHDLLIVPGLNTIAVAVEKSSTKDAMIDFVLTFEG